MKQAGPTIICLIAFFFLNGCGLLQFGSKAPRKIGDHSQSEYENVDLPGYKGGVRNDSYYRNIEVTLSSYLSFSFDDDLTQLQKDYALEDLYRFVTMEVQIPDHSLYAKVFGGNQSTSVFQYMNPRLDYFVPELRGQALLDREYLMNESETLLYSSEEEVSNSRRISTLAYNVGMLVWWRALQGKVTHFRVNSEYLHFPRESPPQAGIIGVGDKLDDYPQAARMGTFVHEPRHHDCTGGVSEANARRILYSNSVPSNQQCGQQHRECPDTYPSGKEHTYAGRSACDPKPGGPYFLGALWAATAYVYCSNCDEEELLNLAVFAIDSVSRLTYLFKDGAMSHQGKNWIEDFFKWSYIDEYGLPDFSSEGIRRGATP